MNLSTSSQISIPERALDSGALRALKAQQKARLPLLSLDLAPGVVPLHAGLKPPRMATAKAARGAMTPWLKNARAKRQRARKRQLKYQTHLRASVGEQGVLATLSMGGSEPDYRRRLDMLWAFMARFRLERKPIAALDAAMSDYADFAYLAGETCEHGDKLKAAMSAIHPQLLPPGPNLLPLFNRALKGCRKASPTYSRVGHPEGATYAICAILFKRGVPAMALFNAALLSTYVRPSALVTLATADVVDPPPASTNMSAFHALLLAPQERQARTKTGEYDATVLLDDVRHPTLGAELAVLRDAQNAAAGEVDPDDVVALWPFQPRHFLREWKAAVRELELSALIKFPYEERHSGPSRDILLRLRTKEEVMGRGHWKTLASLRNYEKAARMQKIAQQIGEATLNYGETTRKSFHTFFQSAVDQGLLCNLGKTNQGDFSAYHL